MAMSSAPARPEAMPSDRRTVQIRGHVPPPPQPAQSMNVRDVPVPVGRVATRSLVAAAPVPDVRSATLVTTSASRRRPERPVAERISGSPDRLAMWAFVMAVFLVVVATLSAH